MGAVKAKIAGIFSLLVGLALAAYCGYVFCDRLSYYGYNVWLLAAFYVLTVVTFSVVCDLVHELAHFAVGRLLKMGTKKPEYRPLGSSSVEVSPRVFKGLRARMIVTAAAGPFSTLLFVALGVCTLAIPSIPQVYVIVLPYSAFLFLYNALPVEYACGKSDGLVIKELVKCDDSARVMLAVLKVQGMVNAGTSLKDVDKSLLFDLPQLAEDDVNFIVLTELRYEYFKALGEEEEAAKYLKRYEEIKCYLPEGYGDR